MILIGNRDTSLTFISLVLNCGERIAAYRAQPLEMHSSGLRVEVTFSPNLSTTCCRKNGMRIFPPMHSTTWISESLRPANWIALSILSPILNFLSAIAASKSDRLTNILKSRSFISISTWIDASELALRIFLHFSTFAIKRWEALEFSLTSNLNFLLNSILAISNKISFNSLPFSK
eukprot:NODE_41_length_34096_cov_2.002235.p23 type:complete len:176 gc:universal NODE_41_length_34096_cov_2.002235:7951-8478(+)